MTAFWIGFLVGFTACFIGACVLVYLIEQFPPTFNI